MKFIKYWNEYNNPFYYWWKVRKYYKFKCKLFIGRYYWLFGDYIRMPKPWHVKYTFGIRM